MSSFIGCKISLISKAGIRYEGILYTIDPRESTVALSKVKSFGTEDRKVDRIIPPRDEIYEYIIFRGSDIQDLNVCEPNKESSLLSEDSAIVRAETSVNTFRNLPPGVMSAGGHHSDGAWPPNSHRAQCGPGDKSGSGGGTNSTSTVKAAANAKPKENGTAIGALPPQIGCNRNNHHQQHQQQHNEVRRQPQQQPQHQPQQMYRHSNNRAAMSATTAEANGEDNGQHQQQRGPAVAKGRQQERPPQRYSNYHDYEVNYEEPAYRYTGNNYHASNDYGPARDYYHMKQSARYRKGDYRRDQYYGNIDASKLRGFESSDGARDYSYSQYYDYKPRNGQDKYVYDTSNTKTKKKPNRESDSAKKDETFKEDYDFETANAIIAKELANLHISQQDKKDLKDEECDKTDGDMSENSDVGYYDKTKSFFDNISSEMLDRASGKSVRPMNRKEERKINVETFGVAESNRNLGRGASKWNRSSKYYPKSGRSSNYAGGPYKANSNDTYKKDSSYKVANRGYVPGRRPVLADGPGRGDD